ncbi:hypothetical protein [Scytonema hofmannii]|nr:hypothetical protein [Scytonema hofmannii]
MRKFSEKVLKEKLGTIVGGATLAGALYAASKAPSSSCDEEDES